MITMALGVIVAFALWVNIDEYVKSRRRISQLRSYIEFNDGDSQQPRRIKFHDKILSIDSSYSWSYYNRGLDYLEIGNYDESIADLVRYTSLKPLSINGRLTLAEAYRYKGLYDRAKIEMETAFKLFNEAGYDEMEEDESLWYDEDYADYLSLVLERGQLYFCLEEYDKAIRDFTYCIDSYGGSDGLWSRYKEQCYYLRSLSHQKVGMLEMANQDLEKVSQYFNKEYYNDCSW